jgi:hypothetical protein
MATAVSAYVHPELVDQLIELYCDWRTECAELHAAYERFSAAPARDRAAAFEGYAAALDREEAACDAYAAQIRLVKSRCADEDEPAGLQKAHRW